MNNKPKYNLFKNTKYALSGLFHVLKTENSFKLELLFAIFIIISIIVIDVSFTNKLILLVTGVLVLIVELLNSAIENVVDLVTKEYAPLAKTAKDIGSTAVMFCISLHIICWIMVILYA
ncbi:diacylglycerol kinase [Malaciobacter molluscorum LMG 25693]|uniref:Diacylglycerol kinase n=1 Tax=Malaciobacter molluscorum LMG 25693 TaxID=870501 RepID=A0A2G1DKF5_9BACT|nr:diacylglycerol kinase [Malaciobacter molluscorum]AXX92914.1 diacylglycerol kinase [Malaciobacter molluscorum LMG 25693]PHO18796.1 diacylglycerol kinase [Malaciobacter molluscorum LMG 25693]